MENNYRDMIDAVKAPEGLRRSVVNISEQDRAKKARPLPVRVALVAACVGVLLVVGVVAAEVLGFDFVKIFKDGEEKIVHVVRKGDDGAETLEDLDLLYEVDGSGLASIPLRELSPALQEVGEQYKNEDRHTESLIFDSWAEAEEFLGLEIADNAMLEGLEYMPSTIWTRDFKPDRQGNCITSADFKYGEPVSVDVDAQYRLPLSEGESAVFSVSTDFFIGEELPLCPHFVYIDNGYWTVAGQEDYLTANGMETVIIDVKQVWDEQISEAGEYHTFFFLRGVRFMVKIHYSGPEDQEIVLAGLKEVLDNFK